MSEPLYDIQRNLVNHPPTEETQQVMEHIRSYVHELAFRMDGNLPAGRERALAFTKLEEATMWAMAALARDDFDREREGEMVKADPPAEETPVVELSGHAMGYSGVNRTEDK